MDLLNYYTFAPVAAMYADQDGRPSLDVAVVFLPLRRVRTLYHTTGPNNVAVPDTHCTTITEKSFLMACLLAAFFLIAGFAIMCSLKSSKWRTLERR